MKKLLFCCFIIFYIFGNSLPIQAAIEPPVLISRSQWITSTQEKYTRKYWKPKKNVNKLFSDYQTPKYFVIHHTEAIEGEDGIERMRNIFDYHATVRKWGDIGYNYVIDSDGTVYEGRKGGNGVRGAHSLNSFNGKNYNYGSIGIAVIGDYDKEKLSDKAQASLEKLIGFLAYANNINLDSKVKAFVPINKRKGLIVKNYKKVKALLGHRDVDETTCPGDNIYSKLDEIKEQAQQYQSLYRQYSYTTGTKTFIIKSGYRYTNKKKLSALTLEKGWFQIFKKKEK